MKKQETPGCVTCGIRMRLRRFNMIYAWFCYFCSKYDERVEIEITPLYQ